MNFIEESIATGETIREGWETFNEREARLQEECGKNDEKFHPEDDYAMPGRQAGEYSRALQQAEKGNNTTQRKH